MLMQQQRIKHLFNAYCSNQIREEELQEFFDLLSRSSHDQELRQLLDELWEQTAAGKPMPVAGRRHLPPLLLKIAAALLLLAGAWGIFRWVQQHPVIPAMYAGKVIKNNSGNQPLRVVLPDQSVVWLNAASSIAYPQSFSHGKREVTLLGEAFFEVAPLPGQPFIVYSGRLHTRVLGTSFNVKAYQDDPHIQVTVFSGKVNVNANDDTKNSADSGICLTASQQAVFKPADRSLVYQEHVDTAGAGAWKRGEMIFHNTPLPEVLNALQRRFNVAISADPKLQHCLVFGEFLHEPADTVLSMLAISLSGKVTRTKNRYYITGSGCF
jgi:transmembrane sensor